MMELALKLISTLAKGGKTFKVESMAFNGDGGDILLSDLATGEMFTLELKHGPVYSASRVRLPDPEPEVVSAPTTMAKKGPVDFAPTFRMIRAAREWPTLSNEAKSILSELERAELRIGDDVTLIAAAKKAGVGDLTALHQLAEQRRPPAARAGAPPLQN